MRCCLERRPYRTFLATPVVFACTALFLLILSAFSKPLESLAAACQYCPLFRDLRPRSDPFSLVPSQAFASREPCRSTSRTGGGGWPRRRLSR